MKNIRNVNLSKINTGKNKGTYKADIQYLDLHGVLKRTRPSTGKTNRAEAVAWCENYVEQKLLLSNDMQRGTANGSMTLDKCCGTYVEERKDVANAATLEREIHNMKILIQNLGRDTLVSEISTDLVLNRHTNKRKKQTRTVIDRESPKIEQMLPNGKVVTDYPRKQVSLSHATITTELKLLKAIMNYAKKVWKVEVGDFSLKEQKLKEVAHRENSLSGRDEFWALIHALPLHAALPAMFVTLTGARPINARKLRWEHINFKESEVRLIGVKDPNNSEKDLLIPLHPKMQEALMRMGPKENGPVFTYGGKCKCAYCKKERNFDRPIGDISSIVKKAFVKIGLPNSRLYDLRHTFATWLVNDDVELAVIQELLGHSSIETTQKYARVKKEIKKNSIGKINI